MTASEATGGADVSPRGVPRRSVLYQREVLASDAMTLALVGCGVDRCPLPCLCASCHRRFVALLARAATLPEGARMEEAPTP